MKKLFILAFMLVGTVLSVNSNVTSGAELCSYVETGTLTIALPSGEPQTFRYTGNPEFPCCGEIVEYDTETSGKEWSFPVYQNGHYMFTMSGNTCTMDEIIFILESLFDLNIVP